MKVGDLVRHKNHPITGIILKVYSSDNTFTEYRCLWSDGEICNVVDWLVMPCK
jgi:heat shock protein HspQ